MNDFPAYDEIHVISDLHMGGQTGFQILRETDRLARFIDWVGVQRPGQRVALILNGDVIDTLAEDIAGYVAVDDALPTLERIMGDAHFKPVWDALAAFVKLDRRHLVLVIGNHDIELAFPHVQRRLLERLCGNSAPARARIELSTMGAGYACTVGNAQVFCTHGNEVDPWNFNRYEDIARVARRINSGRHLYLDEWTPNAGTRMVRDVMNEVKRKYAWIDLLKPETATAVGTLLAIDPSQLGKIAKLPAIVGARIGGDVQVDQRLSADSLQRPPPRSGPPALEALLGANVRQSMRSVGASPGPSGDEMLLALENPATPAKAFGDVPLGVTQLVWDRLTGWLSGVSPEEALRVALLDWWRQDRSLDRGHRDETCTEIVAKLGQAVDFVVTGHTHLERAIDLGGRYYFNSGTWIRLIHFDEALLADRAAFAPLYQILKRGKMCELDNANFGGKPLVLDQSSSVSIGVENGVTVGKLNHVNASGVPQCVEQFPRGR